MQTRQIPHLLASLLLAGTVGLAACRDSPTQPESRAGPVFAKPSCPGHPSCQPDDPPDDPGTAPDPAIAFTVNGELWVMNADGSHQTRIPAGDVRWASTPSWAPTGEGTEESPYRIIFDSDWALYTVNVWTDASSVRSTVPQQVIMVPSRCEGAWEPDWGKGGEILFHSEVLDSPEYTSRRLICVIPDANLSLPTPSVVYAAEHGVTEQDSHGLGPSSWNSAGDAIAFVESHEAPLPEGGRRIGIVGRATGGVTIVSHYGEYPEPHWGLDWSNSPGNTSALAISTCAPKKKHGCTGEIQVMDLAFAGGAYQRLGSSYLQDGAFAGWSPDDTQLVVSDLRSLKTVDAATGEVLNTLTNKDGRHSDWRR